MGVRYDEDVILWAQEQARLLRNGEFSQLDIEHIADEIEDVGKSEKRELASRMAVLKWRLQAELRSNSRRATINDQRKRIALAVKETPSLKAALADPDWREESWLGAKTQARKETGLSDGFFPQACPWDMELILDKDFWPDDGMSGFAPPPEGK
jgi:hypothetical protein